jgi:hypothetical protein
LANRNSGILGLPVPVLARLLNFGQTPDEFNAVFRFLIDSLAVKGANASVLFATLDVSRLSIAQLVEMRDNPTLVQNFVITGVYNRFWRLMEDQEAAIAMARKVAAILDPTAVAAAQP